MRPHLSNLAFETRQLTPKHLKTCPSSPVAETPVRVKLHAALTVGLTNGSDDRKALKIGTSKLLFVIVVAVPKAPVPATPVTVTFASPSTSTDTEPRVATPLGTLATA
jgi:hypothetical protein